MRHDARSDAMTMEAVATNGVRFSDRRVEARASVGLTNDDGTLCGIVLVGVGELHERAGSFLLRPELIIVRPGRWSGSVTAGPEGLRLAVAQYAPRVIRQLGLAAVGLSASRTFLGRSSVELAWRALADMEAGDELTTEALRVFSEGIAIGLARYARHDHGGQSPLAARARRGIDRHIARPLDVSALAAELGCSAAYLSRLFRKTYGFSPTEYLLRRRCERARLLLARDDTPVGEVAAALGFHDASHFARHFRRQCGTSPHRFRQLHRQVKSVPKE